MRQKRLSKSGRGEFWCVVSRVHQKRTFAVDSRDSGLVYLHKVGLASHIRNGNFGEVCVRSYLDIRPLVERSPQRSAMHDQSALYRMRGTGWRLWSASPAIAVCGDLIQLAV